MNEIVSMITFGAKFDRLTMNTAVASLSGERAQIFAEPEPVPELRDATVENQYINAENDNGYNERSGRVYRYWI